MSIRACADLTNQHLPDREGKNRAFPDRTFTANPLSSIPEIHEFELQLGDEFLVMACDGLWDVISSQEAVTCIKDELMQRRSPQQALQKLFEEAMDRSTVDNVTIILVCFEPSSAAQQKKPFGSKSILRETRVASEINIVGSLSREARKNKNRAKRASPAERSIVIILQAPKRYIAQISIGS